MQRENLIFHILFYLTSMSPAYLLFTLNVLYLAYSNEQIEQQTIWIIWGLAIVLTVLLAYFFKKWLLHHYTNSDFEVLDKGEDYLSPENITVVNGDAVSFLISNITSVFTVQSYVFPSIFAFVLMQLVMIVVFIRSNTMITNVGLILSGIDFFKTDKGEVFLNFNQKLDVETHISQIGENNLSKTYLTNNHDIRGNHSES